MRAASATAFTEQPGPIQQSGPGAGIGATSSTDDSSPADEIPYDTAVTTAFPLPPNSPEPHPIKQMDLHPPALAEALPHRGDRLDPSKDAYCPAGLFAATAPLRIRGRQEPLRAVSTPSIVHDSAGFPARLLPPAESSPRIGPAVPLPSAPNCQTLP